MFPFAPSVLLPLPWGEHSQQLACPRRERDPGNQPELDLELGTKFSQAWSISCKCQPTHSCVNKNKLLKPPSLGLVYYAARLWQWYMLLNDMCCLDQALVRPGPQINLPVICAITISLINKWKSLLHLLWAKIRSHSGYEISVSYGMSIWYERQLLHWIKHTQESPHLSGKQPENHSPDIRNSRSKDHVFFSKEKWSILSERNSLQHGML